MKSLQSEPLKPSDYCLTPPNCPSSCLHSPWNISSHACGSDWSADVVGAYWTVDRKTAITIWGEDQIGIEQNCAKRTTNKL